MLKFLIRTIWFIILLAACSPSRNTTSKTPHNSQSDASFASGNSPSNIDAHGVLERGVIDSASALRNDSLAFTKPLSLMDLPTTENGDIVLQNKGYYEAVFKSYCLQPGTPSPTNRDAYLQGPLSSNRKEIVETILRNSLKKPYLEQKNVQLLLWSVVSGSNYNKLSYEVQSTASQLLTQKQIFELKGGVMGVIKTVSSSIPDKGTGAFHAIAQMLDLGTSSYEAYERAAVLREPSVITHPDYKLDQWNKQEEGYYLRYFPDSYKSVKIQVYVPEGLLDSTNKHDGKFILLDPVNMMAIPANSNAQRLGIGGPIKDVVRKVIIIAKENGQQKKDAPAPAPSPAPTQPKSTKPVYQGPKQVVQN